MGGHTPFDADGIPILDNQFTAFGQVMKHQAGWEFMLTPSDHFRDRSTAVAMCWNH